MLIQIKDKIVSTQLFERKFVCDLNACKGACCVEGDAGAPLTFEEIDLLEDNLEHILPFMRPEGIAEVEESGVFYMDVENEPVTTLVNEKECAFVYFDEAGISKCAVETAFNAGKINFQKPLSCHLYPIRIKEVDAVETLTYAIWPICAPACSCGESLDVPVFRFLKAPIIRAFGEDFFEEMAVTADALKNRRI
jgi:hypothetical protein